MQHIFQKFRMATPNLITIELHVVIEASDFFIESDFKEKKYSLNQAFVSLKYGQSNRFFLYFCTLKKRKVK